MIDTTVFQNKTAVYYTLGCKLNFSEMCIRDRLKDEEKIILKPDALLNRELRIYALLRYYNVFLLCRYNKK